jgi:catechol 2,3-dioxygenase-like lactoylglutathione lyase family enzyme
VRIVQATFPASDPRALAAWYVETLGVAPAFVSGETSPHHFAFHVADLEPWKRRLDVSEEHDFSSWGGARAVYFRDPEDNVVELIARSHARPELALAEVGLPVDDVAAAVDALERELGLRPYRDGDDSFAPLGDDDGLLIVVRVGRGWFPVGVPSGKAPVEVTVAGVRAGELALPGSRHRIKGVE